MRMLHVSESQTPLLAVVSSRTESRAPFEKLTAPDRKFVPVDPAGIVNEKDVFVMLFRTVRVSGPLRVFD